MKIKKMFKSVVVCFAMVATLFSVMPTIQVSAATNGMETRYINGDGVRLRKEGWLGGKILELMYDGEKINYFPDIYGSDTEYNYMQRIQTSTYGFVDHHYTRNYQ